MRPTRTVCSALSRLTSLLRWAPEGWSPAPAPDHCGETWQELTLALAGIWLLGSPVALGFENEVMAVQNAAVVGSVLVICVCGAFPVQRELEETVIFSLGLWLLACPLALEYQPLAAANALATGAVVLPLAAATLRAHSRAP